MKARKDDGPAGFVSTTPVLLAPTTLVPVRIVQNSLAPVQVLPCVNQFSTLQEVEGVRLLWLNCLLV